MDEAETKNAKETQEPKAIGRVKGLKLGARVLASSRKETRKNPGALIP
jgi:hypothetical protein